MDREEPFTFEATDSGPASDAGTDTGQRDGASQNPQGRIDPAIARATASGESPAPVTTSEPIGDTTGAAEGNAPGSATGEPAKRGRGRPRKDQTNAGQASSLGSEPRADNSRNVRVSFIEKTLYSIHLAAAGISKCPELALDKDDAKKLAEATAGVLALYKIRMTPKQEAYGLLIEAMATVYPPMLFSVYLRKKMEAEQRKKQGPVIIPPSPPPPAARATAANDKSPQSPAPAATAAFDGFDPANISIPN